MDLIAVWKKWVKEYGEENVLFVARSIDRMRRVAIKWSYPFMIESIEAELLNTVDNQ